MSEEMQIDGKSYISSKRASQLSGYAQDYIGQLARKSLIDAQRIGGLWYISMESLESYKKKADEYKPEPPVVRSMAPEPSALVFFDGKEYISASRASQITGYTQDYVGQLGRSGKILSQQVGNRWYVEKESILGHKSEKDRLLASVQRESVGLQRPQTAPTSSTAHATSNTYAGSGPFLNYYQENGDLMPVTGKESVKKQPIQALGESDDDLPSFTQAIPIYSIPIKRGPAASPQYVSRRVGAEIALPEPKTSSLPLLLGAAATIIIVLSIGYVSVFKQDSVYALGIKQFGGFNSLPASVDTAFSHLGDILEPYLTHELIYQRIGSQ